MLHGEILTVAECPRVSRRTGDSCFTGPRRRSHLYYEQWMRLLDYAEELRAFLEANKDKLKLKGQREAAGAAE